MASPKELRELFLFRVPSPLGVPTVVVDVVALPLLSELPRGELTADVFFVEEDEELDLDLVLGLGLLAIITGDADGDIVEGGL